MQVSMEKEEAQKKKVCLGKLAEQALASLSL